MESERSRLVTKRLDEPDCFVAAEAGAHFASRVLSGIEGASWGADPLTKSFSKDNLKNT